MDLVALAPDIQEQILSLPTMKQGATPLRKKTPADCRYFELGPAKANVATGWNVPSLNVGDEVTIKLVEVSTVDPPSETRQYERRDHET